MRTWKVVLWVAAGVFLACRPETPSPEAPVTPEDSPHVPEQPSPGDTGSVSTPPPDTKPPSDVPRGKPRETWWRGSYPAGSSPEGLAVGDFDGDGAPDVAVNAGGHNYSSRYVARSGEFLWLRNDGKGRLAQAGPVTSLRSSGRILAGDLDGDGHSDVLVGTDWGLRVFLGQGDGAWAARTPTGFGGGSIASLGLWSAPSGRPVLWDCGNYEFSGPQTGSCGCMLRRQTDSGQWESVRLRLTGGNENSLLALYDNGWSPAVADFNEDGLPDIVMNTPKGIMFSWEANIFLGTSWGDVQPVGFFPRTQSFERVYAADFNRDGHMDVLGLSRSLLELYLGDGRGHFAGGSTQTLTAPAEDVLVADFDGDGLEDVVALHAELAEVSLLRSGGDGSLVPHGRLAVGRRPTAAAVVDLDRDGTRELLVAEADDNQVSVYAIPPKPEFGPFPPPACTLPLLEAPASADVHAEPLVRLEVGQVMPPSTEWPWRVGRKLPYAQGDFDGDGRKDLALAQRDGVRLVLQRAPGTFVTRDVPEAPGVQGLTAGDFDGDGYTDLVLLSPEMDPEASIRWNDARGQLRDHQPLVNGHDALAEDFNRDGRVDLVVTTPGGCLRPVYRYTNLGGRRFRREQLADYNPEPDDSCADVGAAIAGDFNGDGTLDLVHSTLGLNVNLTARDGTSLPGGRGFTGWVMSHWDSWAVDADGDGHTDLVHRGDPLRGRASVRRGDGTGMLQVPMSCELPSAGRVFSWADLNADGHVDVLGETPEGQGLWVLLAAGEGQGSRLLRYALGGEVEWARGMDLWGDARSELVVLMRSGELRVYPAP